MHVISYKKIREFCKRHTTATSPLDYWYRIVRQETFRNFADVKRVFPIADQVGNFVVFNIGGNKYRFIAFLRYPLKRLFIRHILTHDEYGQDQWKEDVWFKSTRN
jgi:mRNA interferase HigB